MSTEERICPEYGGRLSAGAGLGWQDPVTGQRIRGF